MKRALIVDDHPQNLDYLNVLLESAGWKVESACHGAEALAKARRNPPQVIVSDLLMPVMDGYTLLRHWKADSTLSGIPFLVYTATYTQAEDERLALRLGADAFIVKPAEPEDLLEKLERICDADTTASASDSACPEDETGLLKQYSETLIRKLEEKMLQLEQANAQLTEDIARRKKAELALRKNEAQFRLLTETMPQIVWMARADGWHLHFNRRWTEFTGLTLAQSLGKRWIDALHPNDRERAQAAWRQAIKQGNEYEIEYRIRNADGEYHWMLGRALPIEQSEDSNLRWFGTCTDIEGIKRATDALSSSEERFRLLAKATNDAIWDWDMTSGKRWWSEGHESLFGHRRDDDTDSSSWTERIHPEDRDAVVGAINHCVEAGDSNWHSRYRYQRSDGSYADVEDRGQLLRDENGRVVRMVGGVSDISERLALESQLQQSQRLESIGQLTGGVAHDFNNMLTVILGSAEVLLERDGCGPKERLLSRLILDAARRGADLTQRLLAFARQQALLPKVVDVNTHIHAIEDLLRRTLGEHIAINLHYAEEIWPALVDPAQLENALMNLSINARDAMEEGGLLTIETRNVSLDQDYVDRQAMVRAGDYIVIAVSDTGCGISQQYIDRVFEPFFTTKGEGKGSGLGLAMVYGFIKQSGGHVTVYSEPDQGTTIKLYLPRADEAVAPQTEPEVSEQIVGGKEKVLLVEDDELVQKFAQDQLKSLGYRVLTASNGEQALALLADHDDVDLLFTDVVMPGMNGRDLADKALALYPDLAVLYTSGYTQNTSLGRGAGGGDVLLLNKPYRRAELSRYLRLALRPGEDAPGPSGAH